MFFLINFIFFYLVLLYLHFLAFNNFIWKQMHILSSFYVFRQIERVDVIWKFKIPYIWYISSYRPTKIIKRSSFAVGFPLLFKIVLVQKYFGHSVRGLINNSSSTKNWKREKKIFCILLKSYDSVFQSRIAHDGHARTNYIYRQ